MGLKIANAVLYTGLALFAAATLARPLKMALIALSHRYSYTPDLNVPWLWLLFAVGLALVLATGARRLALGRKAGIARYGAILFLMVAILAARKGLGTPERPMLEDGLEHLIARVQLAADDFYTRQKKYPDRPDLLTAQWPPELMSLGFYRRGAIPLRSHLLVKRDAFGPVLIPGDDVQPGDLIFALSKNSNRYWMTAFILSHGRLEPLQDSTGRVVVAGAVEGHATSRLDPLFPEYPNKLPHAGSM